MEGDLDEMVELCASLLTSEDGITKGCSLLMDLCQVEEVEQRLRFAKVAQEIAACNGGAILRRLLWLALDQSDRIGVERKAREIFLACDYILSLTMLTSTLR